MAKKAVLGQQIAKNDRIRVKHRPVNIQAIFSKAKPSILVYHKPIGRVVSHKPQEKQQSVYQDLPPAPSGKWLHIGRLDINSSGLLLFTNHGSIANYLMHPQSSIAREYLVRLDRPLADNIFEQLQQGLEVDGRRIEFAELHPMQRDSSQKHYFVVLKTGQNREIRKAFEHFHLQVSRLKRLRYGNILLPKWLRQKQSHFLQESEIRHLLGDGYTRLYGDL